MKREQLVIRCPVAVDVYLNFELALLPLPPCVRRCVPKTVLTPQHQLDIAHDRRYLALESHREVGSATQLGESIEPVLCLQKLESGFRRQKISILLEKQVSDSDDEDRHAGARDYFHSL